MGEILTIENLGAERVKRETCKCCGKIFFRTPLHVYKTINPRTGNIKWFCTWSCLQKYRNGKLKRKRNYVVSEKEMGE